MSKQHRWICPSCGSGALLGSRPRRNATSRYCLPCSTRTGYLVERDCPTLNAKRAEKHERKAALVVEHKARERVKADAKVTFAGINVRDETRRVIAVARTLGKMPPVRSVVIRTRREGRHTSGYARYSGHIVLTLSHEAAPCAIKALIAHEVAHVLHGGVDGPHSESYWTCLAELVEAAYGVHVPVLIGVAWKKQQQVRDALTE